ncbi:UDP-D-apiose/UDP-D-xylose synthase 2 [Abeliophyllum distichum]|uniref:UDP-D-apiose/UDP-D-xylose synthase 2 n=1 Tax=Abeliophyllum distichum TaxID=126358 RepID=A0ABD1RHT5_9LAMI
MPPLAFFGPIEKRRWSYACAKQLIERFIYAEGADNGLEYTIVRPGANNGLEYTIVRPFNWIGLRMDFIPRIDGPSEGVPRVLACFSNVLSYRKMTKQGNCNEKGSDAEQKAKKKQVDKEISKLSTKLKERSTEELASLDYTSNRCWELKRKT